LQQENTFPSFAPKYALDLFLGSKEIQGKTWLLNKNISDHIAVVTDISL